MTYDYDAQIARLTKNPRGIRQEWSDSIGLFQFATNTEDILVGKCGCITMIRNHPEEYGVYINYQPHEELTEAIAADERLPKSDIEIELRHLPVFKEWQEKLDQYRK